MLVAIMIATLITVFIAAQTVMVEVEMEDLRKNAPRRYKQQSTPEKLTDALSRNYCSCKTCSNSRRRSELLNRTT